jgi:hypothetical protein
MGHCLQQHLPSEQPKWLQGRAAGDTNFIKTIFFDFFAFA